MVRIRDTAPPGRAAPCPESRTRWFRNRDIVGLKCGRFGPFSKRCDRAASSSRSTAAVACRISERANLPPHAAQNPNYSLIRFDAFVELAVLD